MKHLIGMSLVFLLTGAGVLALDLSPVRQVTVLGELSAAQRQDVGKALAVFKPGPQQVAAIKSAIEALPWVSHVNVGRDWPFGMEAQVVPEAVIAHWNQGAFISEKVEVLETALLDGGGDLPRLSGPPGSALEVVQGYQEFARTLAPSRHRIAQLALSERGAWAFRTAEGLKVHLGREQAHSRLERFLQVSQSLDQRRLAYDRVDARYPTGLAVRLLPQPKGGRSP